MQVFGENLHRSFGSRRILQLESQTRRIFDRKQSTTTNKILTTKNNYVTKLELTAVCRHFNRHIHTIGEQFFQNGAVETRKMSPGVKFR